MSNCNLRKQPRRNLLIYFMQHQVDGIDLALKAIDLELHLVHLQAIELQEHFGLACLAERIIMTPLCPTQGTSKIQSCRTCQLLSGRKIEKQKLQNSPNHSEH